MGKKAIFLFLALLINTLAHAHCEPLPQILVGGGYWEAGANHSGSLAQAEYRFGRYLWWKIRPEIVAIFPELRAAFFGAGLGIEFYLTENLLIYPNFTPGVYFQGRGRNLGYPIEFRSSIEVAYEWCSGFRIGGQFYHISNASLGKHNPGGNAYVLYVGFPLLR